ncbi:tyrosine-type recombinase/integrase [Streptomyces sp. S1D4-11]|nr:site-specific integrase [Streptomyces sp. S1D4-11]QIY99426.1 site-specific integrase [Streptomyces sp. S1D4-11]
MASVVPRKNKAGKITSYQVKWRDGGSKTGDWQTERFDDEPSATVFKEAVDEAGQNWPPGWVKGKGYIDPETADELRYRFDRWAVESIKNRTAGERYKKQRIRSMEMYLFPTFGNCDIRSTDHFSKATIGAWINKMMKTKVKRGSKVKDMSPETLRGLHSLFSSVLKEAVVAEPPLRDRNPCDLTRLPSNDDWGIDDEQSSDDMEYMTPEEIAGLVDCFPRPEDRMLVRMTYGTGMRWGEVIALARRHARNTQDGKYEARVTRAWKSNPGEPWFLGPPKTKAGRRTIEFTAGLWQELLNYGLAELGKDDLIFHNGNGNRLPYSTFYERWLAAVAEAKKRGVLPEWKFPTFHDLRHSHVAALLSDNHSLTYVQRRLGHESIKTTSDRYGHLLETAHKAALVTIDRVMGFTSPDGAAPPENGRGRDGGRGVYVAHVGSQLLGFWRAEHAEETAERWARERGGAVRVEKRSADWWGRSTGGRVGEDNGLKTVRSEVPHRAWIWSLGPAVYKADGTECVVGLGVHEPSGRWVWDWEDDYTEEPAHSSTQWRPGVATETEARAWGPDEEAVRAAYATARTDALRICPLHPDSAATPGRDAVT